jgi:hypothetical protein
MHATEGNYSLIILIKLVINLSVFYSQYFDVKCGSEHLHVIYFIVLGMKDHGHVTLS